MAAQATHTHTYIHTYIHTYMQTQELRTYQMLKEKEAKMASQVKPKTSGSGTRNLAKEQADEDAARFTGVVCIHVCVYVCFYVCMYICILP
jgi:hypothetical protein